MVSEDSGTRLRWSIRSYPKEGFPLIGCWISSRFTRNVQQRHAAKSLFECPFKIGEPGFGKRLPHPQTKTLRRTVRDVLLVHWYYKVNATFGWLAEWRDCLFIRRGTFDESHVIMVGALSQLVLTPVNRLGVEYRSLHRHCQESIRAIATSRALIPN